MRQFGSKQNTRYIGIEYWLAFHGSRSKGERRQHQDKYEKNSDIFIVSRLNVDNYILKIYDIVFF